MFAINLVPAPGNTIADASESEPAPAAVSPPGNPAAARPAGFALLIYPPRTDYLLEASTETSENVDDAYELIVALGPLLVSPPTLNLFSLDAPSRLVQANTGSALPVNSSYSNQNTPVIHQFDSLGNQLPASESIQIAESFAVQSTAANQPVTAAESIPISKTVSQQAAAAIKTEFASIQQPSTQSITIQIDPPELGRINIQIEVAADRISAQIVASEAVAAEWLSREKNTLLQSLNEFGFGQASVDISHGSTPDGEPSRDGEDSAATLPLVSMPRPKAKQVIHREHESVLLVGINLVA